jgi:hypothetical protein
MKGSIWGVSRAASTPCTIRAATSCAVCNAGITGSAAAPRQGGSALRILPGAADTVGEVPASNGQKPPTKRLTPMPDGSLLENEERWEPGAKTIEQRTLELLDDGYALIDTRIDGSRFFEHRPT